MTTLTSGKIGKGEIVFIFADLHLILRAGRYAGPMGAKYGAAVTTGLVGKDERNGRINPALDINDDVANTTTAAVQRKPSVVGKVYKQGYEQTTTGF